MKDDFLEQFEASETIKAFSVLLSRYIAKDPSILLELEKSRPINVNGAGWKELYDDLQQEGKREKFQRNVEKTANNHDWNPISEVFAAWGKYGWITDSDLGIFDFWDALPPSQEEADRKILDLIDENFLLLLRKDIEEKAHSKAILNEVFFCFNNNCFTACASLLASLIDGVLTSNPANFTTRNKKTGDGASKKMIAELKKDDMLGLPGYFNLELVNFNSFISTFFAHANGFESEPPNLNRNYLHHGMSNRRITRVDCIKLLIAYRKTLKIAKFDTAEG